MPRSDREIEEMRAAQLPRRSPRNNELFPVRYEASMAGGQMKSGCVAKMVALGQSNSKKKVPAKNGYNQRQSPIASKKAKVVLVSHENNSESEDDDVNILRSEDESENSVEKKTKDVARLLTDEEFKAKIEQCIDTGKLPRLDYQPPEVLVVDGKPVKDIVIKAMNGGNLLACSDISVDQKKKNHVQEYALKLVKEAWYDTAHCKFLFDPKVQKEQSLTPVEGHVTALVKLCIVTKFDLRETNAAHSDIIRRAFMSLGYKGRAKNAADRRALLAKMPEVEKVVEFIKKTATLDQMKDLQAILADEISAKEDAE